MDRTQKKCFIGSTLAHIALIACVFLFAGFGSNNNSTETFVPITIIDLDKVLVTDGPTRGGGSGSAIPTPPQMAPPKQVYQPPPQPKQQSQEPAPLPQEKPVPQPKTTVKTKPEPADDSIPIDVNKKPTAEKSRPRISTNLVTRVTGTGRAQTAKTTQYQSSGSKIAEQFNNAIKNIGATISSGGLQMNDLPGFGGGGPAMVNYTQLVMSIFDRAWNPPSTITDENLVTEVEIVIHRNGKVTSTRIKRRSGNTAMDESVRRALDSVRTVPAFPPEAKDFERTFIIEFNLKAKLARG